MSPKIGHGIGRGPRTVRASGPPHEDTRDMETPRDVTLLAPGQRDPMGHQRTVRSPRREVAVTSRPRRQKTCICPSFFASPKLLLLRDHKQNGDARDVGSYRPIPDCRNLGVFGVRGSYDTGPVDGGTSGEKGSWGFN